MHQILLLTNDHHWTQLEPASLGSEYELLVEKFAPDKITSEEIQRRTTAASAQVLVFGPDVEENILLETSLAISIAGRTECLALANPTENFLRKAMQSGVRDVVDPSGGPDKLTKSLLVLERISKAKTAYEANKTVSERDGIVAIVGPIGGVGKSTIAVNTAVALAQEHPNEVVLVDLDLVAGEIAELLHIEATTDISHLAVKDWVVNSTNLKLSLASHASGLLVLPAPSDLGQAEKVDEDVLGPIFEQLRNSFRYVIIDTGPGSTDATLAAIQTASDVIFVTCPEVSGVRVLDKHMKALHTVGLVSRKQHLILNKANPKSGLTQEDIESIVGLEVSIVLPEEPKVITSGNQAIPYLEMQPKSPLSSGFKHAAHIVKGETVTTTNKPKSRGWFK